MAKKEKKRYDKTIEEFFPDFVIGETGIQGDFVSDVTKEIVEENFDENDIVEALQYFDINNEWVETDTFTVLGDVVPQSRPRSAALPGKGVIVYDEPDVRIWKNNIRLVVQNSLPNNFAPIQGEIHFYMNVFRRIPKGFSKRKTILAELGLIRPEKTPDLDNFVKSTQDALKGVLWMDDCTITFTESKKFYSLKPRLEFLVRFRRERMDK